MATTARTAAASSDHQQRPDIAQYMSSSSTLQRRCWRDTGPPPRRPSSATAASRSVRVRRLSAVAASVPLLLLLVALLLVAVVVPGASALAAVPSKSGASPPSSSPPNNHQPETAAEKETGVKTTRIAWFRPHALRVRDNDAFAAALEESSQSAAADEYLSPSKVVPLYLWTAPPRPRVSDDDDADADADVELYHPVDVRTGGTASDVFVARCLDGLNGTLDGRLRIGLVGSPPPRIGGAVTTTAEAEAEVLADEIARVAASLEVAPNNDAHDASLSGGETGETPSPARPVEVFYLASSDAALEDALHSALLERGVVPRSFGGGYALLDYTRERDHLPSTMRRVVEGHPFRSPLIPFVDYVLERLEREPPAAESTGEAPSPEETADKLAEVREWQYASHPVTTEELLAVVGKTGTGLTDWGSSIAAAWPASEDDAEEALRAFLDSLDSGGNADDRDGDGTREERGDRGTDAEKTKEKKKTTHLASRLSPYLARGVLSAKRVYNALLSRESSSKGGDGIGVVRRDAASLVRRLCWRDYTYAVSSLFPDAARGGRPVREGYEDDSSSPDDADDEDGDSSSSADDAESDDDVLLLRRWKDGTTGFPLIDAGMRQLAAEGYMPQKVRLAASTCLVEGLGLPWRSGMDHFAAFLVDYDRHINAHMWMNAGCVGFDPYYVGGEYKRRPYWDGTGEYVRRWCPELARLPDRVEVEPPEGTGAGGTNGVDCLYAPWLAPLEVLREAGVTLGVGLKGDGGTSYPLRACDEREGRRRFYGRLRERRARWSPNMTDEKGRDLVPMGRSAAAERVGVFTPRVLLVSKPP